MQAGQGPVCSSHAARDDASRAGVFRGARLGRARRGEGERLVGVSTFFDGFAVSLERGGVRVLSTADFGDPLAGDPTISVLPMPGTFGGRIGGVLPNFLRIPFARNFLMDDEQREDAALAQVTIKAATAAARAADQEQREAKRAAKKAAKRG